MSVKLFFGLFMQNVLAAETAELFKLQTLRLLFFIFGAVVGDAIARCALKVNGFAHFVPISLALPRDVPFPTEQPGSQKIFKIW